MKRSKRDKAVNSDYNGKLLSPWSTSKTLYNICVKFGPQPCCQTGRHKMEGNYRNRSLTVLGLMEV